MYIGADKSALLPATLRLCRSFRNNFHPAISGTMVAVLIVTAQRNITTELMMYLHTLKGCQTDSFLSSI
jgi:hypothetical protein